MIGRFFGENFPPPLHLHPNAGGARAVLLKSCRNIGRIEGLRTPFVFSEEFFQNSDSKRGRILPRE
ncbi:hypothetical protein CH378_11890 [Leptospira kmetyi]|uniref:DUF4160 domain-containing protein n=1 Tax=Leptospira kmetyi TaxID=408139 RepID=A0ABX4NDV0_9LEPT|nr:hypothetical protein CH378_11890 [Leptospira kmetyi]